MRDDANSRDADTEGAENPRLRVLSGSPTPEELGAVVAVVAAVAGTQVRGDGVTVSRSTWAEPASLVRRARAAGPGGWQASARPPPPLA